MNSAQILIELALDKRRLSEYKKGMEDAQSYLDEFGNTVENTEKVIEEFNESAKRGFDKTKAAIEETAQVADKLGSASGVLLAAGVAMTGSIIASAKSYVEEMKTAGIVGEETVDRWVAAEGRVKGALTDIGRISAEAVLPLLEKAADLAEKGADFVEKNPNLVKSILNIGLVTATIGAVGSLVAKGIKFYTDIAFLGAVTQYTATTAAFAASVNQYSLATGVGSVGKGAGGLATSVGGGLSSFAGSTAAAVIGEALVGGLALYIGANIGTAIANALTGEDKTLEEDLAVLNKFVTGGIGNYITAARNAGIVSDSTARNLWIVTKNIMGLNDAGDKTSDLLVGLSKDLISFGKAGAASYIEMNKQILFSAYNTGVAFVSEVKRFGGQVASSFLNAGRSAFATISSFFSSAVSGIISFISKIISSIQSGLSGFIPGRASGGYVGSGVYRMGENGKEFVLSNSTTKAAEDAIGGSLSQQNIRNAMTKSITVNDNRTFSGEISRGTIEMIKNEFSFEFAGIMESM